MIEQADRAVDDCRTLTALATSSAAGGPPHDVATASPPSADVLVNILDPREQLPPDAPDTSLPTLRRLRHIRRRLSATCRTATRLCVCPRRVASRAGVLHG